MTRLEAQRRFRQQEISENVFSEHISVKTTTSCYVLWRAVGQTRTQRQSMNKLQGQKYKHDTSRIMFLCYWLDLRRFNNRRTLKLNMKQLLVASVCRCLENKEPEVTPAAERNSDECVQTSSWCVCVCVSVLSLHMATHTTVTKTHTHTHVIVTSICRHSNRNHPGGRPTYDVTGRGVFDWPGWWLVLWDEWLPSWTGW